MVGGAHRVLCGTHTGCHVVSLLADWDPLDEVKTWLIDTWQLRRWYDRYMGLSEGATWTNGMVPCGTPISRKGVKGPSGIQP
jgi:hypothetical protein